MAVFKCKMCGGTIEFEQGASVGVCDSCGTKQTLPRLDDDKKTALYDRANHFRRSNEFDKASAIYDQILNEDNTDAEAYWSLVLCRYGIEYVEDPQSHKRIPTVNRAQYTSIFDDEDYKAALQYADGYQREIYEKEAKAINEIQKGILAISQKEDPFDVFICYKETDAGGRRTSDSVLANDLYHQLTQEGFKVFFARITLEDKLGNAYEPYIFAALNSAKVMVVLGTKPEYFSAVWVKNEWSRYLALIKQSGGKKMLIPAYKDMDPYDLPEEFAHLQSQDMSKLGFMQDLIRGIKKILCNENRGVPSQTENTSKANVENLLTLAHMALDMGKENEALDYINKALETDASLAQAWALKMELVANQLKRNSYQEDHLKELTLCERKALECASESTKEDLSKRLSKIYSEAFQGYANSIPGMLRNISVLFDPAWAKLLNKEQYIICLQCLKDAATLSSEMSKTLPDGKDTLLAMRRLYNALYIRMDIVDQQFQWLKSDFQYKVKNLSTEIKTILSEMKENLEAAFPEESWKVEHIVLPAELGEMPDTTLQSGGIIGGILTLIFPIAMIFSGNMFEAGHLGHVITFLLLLLLSIGIALIAVPIVSYKRRAKKFKEYSEHAKKIKEFNQKMMEI